MKAWRIAFRDGSRGSEMWDQCLKNGVAAIAYDGMEFDLSKYPEGEPKDRWARLSPAQKYGLKTFVWKIKRNHTLYVKQGAEIVGKGSVKKSYLFDPRSPIRGERGDRWQHLISVKWEPDFPSVRAWVGDTQLYAIRPLSESDQRKVDRACRNRRAALNTISAIEGKALKREATFRRRNRALIEAKKASSDYCCEVCGFSFEETYGPIGKGFIIAHHVEPVGSRRRASRTNLADVRLICANCHGMIHRKDPPLSSKELRKKLNKT